MKIRVYIENIEIPEQYVDGISVISDLTELYLSGELVLIDMGSTYANKVMLGTEITVKYIADGGQEYANKFRVQSFQKIQDRENISIDLLKMFLVSSWHYNEGPQTLAYKGSYGQWATLLKRCFGNDIICQGFTTEDTPKVRYMVNERPQEFLYRTMRYGLVGGMPVYLHTLPTNKVQIDGIANLTKVKDPDTVLFSKNVLETQAASNNVTSTQSSISTLDSSKKNIRMETFDLNTSCIGNSSWVKYLFTKDHFKCSDIAFASGEITVSSVEKGNKQVSTVSPARVEYLGWEYTPDDAKALAARKGLESVFKTFSMSASLYGTYVDTIYPGKMVKILFTRNSEGEELLGGGLYLVKRAAYQMRKGKQETRLVLVQARN